MIRSAESRAQKYSFLRSPADLLLIALTAVAGLVYSVLESRRDVQDASVFVRTILLVLAGIVAVRAVTYVLFDLLPASSTGGRRRSRLVRIAVALALYTALGLLLLKVQFDLQLTSILLPTAVGTGIIVFAMKPTLGNLVEGIALRLGQPFQIGDQVQVGSDLGIVENITWRSVDLRKRDGSIRVLPNSAVSSEHFTVFPAGEPIRCEVTFPAPMTVPPHRVQEIARRVMASVPNVHPDRVTVTSVTGYHYGERDRRDRVEYGAEYFCEDYDLRVETAGTILERLWYAFARHGLLAPDDSVVRDSSRERVLSSVKALQGLPEEALARLARSATQVLYAPGEAVLRARSRESVFVIASGVIEVRHDARTAMQHSGCVDVDDTLGNGHLPVCRLQNEVLSRCTLELARYIGPYARLVVAEAARTTADEHRLYELLAEEIPEDEARQAFLGRAPQAPTLVLSSGALFGDLSRFTGVPPRTARIVALSAVEVLEIPASAITDELSGDTEPEVAARTDLRDRAEFNLRSDLVR